MNWYWSMSRYLATAAAVMAPAIAFAAEAAPSVEPWYKMVGGVIAIPASIMASAVAYRLFRKTHLESRKLELEIQEKERLLKNIAITPSAEALRSLAEPLALNQRLFVLLLRFVILELTLRIWNFVPAAVRYLTSASTSITLWLLQKKGTTFPEVWSPVGVAVIFGPTAINLLFDAVYWFIVFGFGWPILRDACALLGIEIGSLFDLPFLGRRRSRG